MVIWNLSQIIKKTRAITGTPSQDQLSDQQITDYCNTYYQFTMPFELKEQINQQPYNFDTLPNQDVYPVLNAFQTEEPMAYANGFPLIFYQDRDIFYQDWPQQYTQDQVGIGAPLQKTFTGSTQSSPVIPGTFTITDGAQIINDQGTRIVGQQIAVGTASVGPYAGILASFPIQPGTLEVTDNGIETFLDNGLGTLIGGGGGTGTINYTTGAFSLTFFVAVATGVPITASYSLPSGALSGNGFGTINYVTGVFSATFNAAPAVGVLVSDNYQGYQPARPQGVLFYNNEFTFRPIPDQVYQITMQGFITQVALDDISNPSELPLQTEWGQLIAYGASLEIFSDRGDLGNYNAYYPVFKRYENVALGRFVEQYQNAQSVPRF